MFSGMFTNNKNTKENNKGLSIVPFVNNGSKNGNNKNGSNNQGLAIVPFVNNKGSKNGNNNKGPKNGNNENNQGLAVVPFVNNKGPKNGNNNKGPKNGNNNNGPKNGNNNNGPKNGNNETNQGLAVVPFVNNKGSKNGNNTNGSKNGNNENNQGLAVVPFVNTNGSKNGNNTNGSKNGNKKDNNNKGLSMVSSNNAPVKNNKSLSMVPFVVKNDNVAKSNNSIEVSPLPLNLINTDRNTVQSLKNALKRTNGDVKAKRVMNDMEFVNVTNRMNIKTLDGNKIYYKKVNDGTVRPIIIFIKSASDALNKTNLNVLAKVLSEKMPIRNSNDNGYMFGSSGPFGSGYYHKNYFTTDNATNDIQWINNPLFENKKPLTFGNLIRTMNAMKNNQNALKNNVPNNIFNEYNKRSKENRVMDLSKVVNKLKK